MNDLLLLCEACGRLTTTGLCGCEAAGGALKKVPLTPEVADIYHVQNLAERWTQPTEDEPKT